MGAGASSSPCWRAGVAAYRAATSATAGSAPVRRARRPDPADRAGRRTRRRRASSLPVPAPPAPVAVAVAAADGGRMAPAKVARPLGAVPDGPRPRQARRRRGRRRCRSGDRSSTSSGRGARPGVHDEAADRRRGAAVARPGPPVQHPVVLEGAARSAARARRRRRPATSPASPPRRTSRRTPQRADLRTLARQTAAALTGQGVTPRPAGLRRLAVHRSGREPAVGAELHARRRGRADHARSGSTRATTAGRLRLGCRPVADRGERASPQSCARPASGRRGAARARTAARRDAVAEVESAPLDADRRADARPSATTRAPRCCPPRRARRRGRRRRSPAASGVSARRCAELGVRSDGDVSTTAAACPATTVLDPDDPDRRAPRGGRARPSRAAGGVAGLPVAGFTGSLDLPLRRHRPAARGPGAREDRHPDRRPRPGRDRDDLDGTAWPSSLIADRVPRS